MTNILSDAGGEFKARSGVDYVRFFPRPWRNGCASMTLEQEGLYVRICAFRWDTGKPLTANRTEAARILRINANKYRKVLNELIAIGVVADDGNGLIVERAEREYENAADARGDNRRNPVRKETPKPPASHPRQVRQPGINPVATSGQPGTCFDATPPVEAKKTQQILRASLDKDKDKEERTNVLSESSAKKTTPSGREFWTQVFNPPPEPEHRAVSFENGRLTLHNGFRAEWLGRFGGDVERLDLALMQAANFVQPQSGKPLEAQVAAQLARQVADKLDRDSRYATASAKQPQPAQHWRDDDARKRREFYALATGEAHG